jgi:hypothetical protein
MRAYEKLIIKDLKKVQKELDDFIVHIGLFGSIRNKSVSHVNDIDVLILYHKITFIELKDKISQMDLNYPTYKAYLNVDYISSGKLLNDPVGYHMILMPIENPCHEFLKRHNGNIDYLNESFIYNSEKIKIPGENNWA